MSHLPLGKVLFTTSENENCPRQQETQLPLPCAAAAVHDGFVLQKSVVRTPLAGKLLSECMLKSIESRGTTVHTFYEVEKVDLGAGQLQVLLCKAHPFPGLALQV